MRKTKKGSRINVIREEIERELISKGADLSSSKYNERQFICNHIVRHSFLAPALKYLGVYEGKDIMRCMKQMPGVSFYKYVMWAYYIKRLRPELMPDSEVFGLGYNRALYEEVKTRYYDMRKMMHQERAQSRNTQDAQNDEIKAHFSRMLRDMCMLTDEFAEKYSYTGRRGLYLIVRIIRGDFTAPDVKPYVEDNLDEILVDFQKNGYTRQLLSRLHGVQIPAQGSGDNVVRGTLLANDNDITATFGFTHDNLNYMATEYQDTIKRHLHLMANWEYLEDPEPYFDIEENTEHMLEELENPEICTSGSLTEDTVPKKVMGLARKLSKKHGPVTITSEASGLHIYIADPELLRTDGQKELDSKHLAINADKYFGLNQWDIDLHPTKENRSLYNRYRKENKEIPCAVSMKTKKVYMVSDLLAYTPIQQRHGLFEHVKAAVTVGQINKRLVYDENGNLVPEWVGETVPLSRLPSIHPAVEYLTSRGYDIKSLEEQFEACYCWQALPESRAEGRYYSRLPGGMRNSPQGRIIFSVRMNGVRHGYQSRYIDKWVDNLHYFWSNEQRWELIEERLLDGSIREKYPPDDIFRKGFSPHKYMNATGSERNKLLMGYDAAVAFNADRPKNKRYCILVEGPLDAARIGPPALALLGKSLSPFQAEAIRKQFTHILTVMDNDTAGRQGLAKIHSMFQHNPVTDIQLPPDKKDIGEMTYEEAKQLIEPHIPLWTIAYDHSA